MNSLSRPALSVWIPGALLLLAAIMLWQETARSMVSVWLNSTTFNHAFLVPLISAWLIWRKRADLARVDAAPMPWMLVPAAIACGVWLLGELVVAGVLTHFALVTMLVLTVPALYGPRVATVIAFPLAFLYFMVPFGEFSQARMMEWTADFTVLALRATGVPVYREGLNFVIPSGNWSVVEACSGVRYLIASFMVGTLFAYLNYRSIQRRLTFMALSIAVPIVANWLRAYMIVMIGHLSNNQLAAGVDHLVYGWVFFGVVIGILFYLGSLWAEPEARAGGQGGDAAVSGSVAGAAALRWGTMSAMVLLVGSSQWVAGRLVQPADRAVPVLSMPGEVGPWRQTSAPLPFEPGFVNPTATTAAAYRSGERSVWVHLAYFRGQSADRKLVTSSHRIQGLEKSDWAITETTRLRSREGLPDFDAFTLETKPSLGRTDASLRVHRVYWVGGRWRIGDARVKMWQAIDLISGRPDDGAVVLLVSPIESPGITQPSARDVQAADGILADFARDHLNQLGVELDRARTIGLVDSSSR
jgi:exosortase A